MTERTRFARRCSARTDAGAVAQTRSCQNFRHVQQHSRAPWLRLAALRGAPAAADPTDVEAALDAALPALNRFLAEYRTLGLDGFLIELADRRLGATRAALASTLLRARSRLARAGSISRQIAGQSLALYVFAPCLAPDDPGCTFGLASTFLLFWPLPVPSFVTGTSKALLRSAA